MAQGATATPERALETAKISVRGVSKIFKRDGKEVNVLDNINLEARKGEFVCILGPSGCGKSTLLNIAGGFLEATTGKIGRAHV